MQDLTLIVVVAGLVLAAGGCSRGSDGALGGTKGTVVSAAAPVGECGHAVCAANFFIDTSSAVPCSPGATCAIGLRVVATGAFHINDEYPYRFKADDAKDVQFFGTDSGGKNVFSKSAGDWQKADAKSGAMTVKFTPANAGQKTIAGTLKLSVCSESNCLLEQRQISSPVEVK